METKEHPSTTRIQFFTKPTWVESESSCEGCNGCSPAAGGTKRELAQVISELRTRKGETVEVQVLGFDTEISKKLSMDILNLVLLSSKQDLRVNENNLEAVLAKAAPLIAIDGQLVSVRTVPSLEQIVAAVDDGTAIEVASEGACG